MGVVIQGLLIGIIATIGMDIWAAVVKYVFHLPTTDWAMVGRWFGHMPRGTFAHHPISDAAPIPNELVIGWITTNIAEMSNLTGSFRSISASIYSAFPNLKMMLL